MERKMTDQPQGQPSAQADDEGQGVPYHAPEFQQPQPETPNYETQPFNYQMPGADAQPPTYEVPSYQAPAYEAPQAYQPPSFDAQQAYQPPSYEPQQPSFDASQAYQPPNYDASQAYPPPPPPQQAYPQQMAYTPAQVQHPGLPVPLPGAPYGIDPVSGLPYSDKSKIVAGVLQLLIGGLGVGRFYMGYTGIAIAQILVTFITLGVGLIWPFIDGIMILVGNPRDAQGRPLRS